MKKGFLLKLLLCMLLASITAFGMTACDVFDGDTSGDNLNQDQVNEQILEVYDAYVEYAKENGSEPLSYEEWLISIRGEAGKDGVTPLFRINEHNEKWEMSLDNGKTWTSLGIKAKGDKGDKGEEGPAGPKGDKGEPGKPGQDGITPEIRINKETGMWEISYDEGKTWVSLGISALPEKGEAEDGITPQLRINEETNYWEISYDEGETWESLGVKATGKDGADGEDGKDGQDGVTPTIEISEDGYWVINGIKTEYVAIGKDGQNGADGEDGEDGQDGKTPTIEISEDGYWIINGVKTEYVAIGKDGQNGADGKPGQDGQDGKPGADGKTPTIEISEDGYWVINGVKTEYVAIGKDGQNGADGKPGQDGQDGKPGADGKTPTIEISEDGYWVINGEKTEYVAIGKDGQNGADGKPGQDGATGPQGPQGEQGATGPQGPQGEQGAPGKDGEDGEDGKDGQDGITPQLRVNEQTNYWEISYDNGLTWESLGVKATGKDGVDGENGADGKPGQDGQDGDKGETGATIEKVEFDDQGRIIITLTDGTVLAPVEIPKEDKHEHSFGEWIEATPNYPCQDKIFYAVCSDCAEMKWKHGVESDHVAGDDGYCTICGKQVSDTKGVVYGIYKEKAFVSGYNGTSSRVVIADTYQGYPVTGISSKAFYNNKNIVNVILPESITYIYSEAFRFCSNLKTLNIPSGLDRVGENALTGTALDFIQEDNVVYYGNDDNAHFILIGASQTNLSKYPIHAETQVIGDCAFFLSSYLDEVEIPEGITTLSTHCFAACKRLLRVTIPKTVTTMKDRVFSQCENLASITFEGTVAEWTAMEKGEYWNEFVPAKYVQCSDGEAWLIPVSEGLAYKLNADGTSYTVSGIGTCTDTELVIPEIYNHLPVTGIDGWAFNCCDQLTSVVIPDSIVNVGGFAFNDCYFITDVVIGSGITELSFGMFELCGSLTTVTIPNSVTSIYFEAFDSCYSLTNIIFNGTVAEWGEISIANDFNSSIPAEYVQCLDGKVWLFDVPVEDYDTELLFSAQDGLFFDNENNVLSVDEIVGATVVSAQDENGNQLTVQDGAILGLDLGANDTWKSTYVTLYTEDRALKVSVQAADLIINEVSDLVYFHNVDFKEWGNGNYILTANFDGYYILVNDIDATGYVHDFNRGEGNFNPVGAGYNFYKNEANKAQLANTGLTGTFDGNGYAIKNLQITETGGLFGYINGGTVKNVAFINFTPKMSNSGVLCAYMLADSLMQDTYWYTAETMNGGWNTQVIMLGAHPGTVLERNVLYWDLMASSYFSGAASGAIVTEQPTNPTIRDFYYINSKPTNYSAGSTLTVTKNDDTTVSVGLRKVVADAKYVDGVERSVTETKFYETWNWARCYDLADYASIGTYSGSYDITLLEGVKRYTSLDTLKADAHNNDFSAWNPDVWTIVDGYPQFKSQLTGEFTIEFNGIEIEDGKVYDVDMYTSSEVVVKYNGGVVSTTPLVELVEDNGYISIDGSTITCECDNTSPEYVKVTYGGRVWTFGLLIAYAYDIVEYEKELQFSAIDGLFFDGDQVVSVEDILGPNANVTSVLAGDETQITYNPEDGTIKGFAYSDESWVYNSITFLTGETGIKVNVKIAELIIDEASDFEYFTIKQPWDFNVTTAYSYTFAEDDFAWDGYFVLANNIDATGYTHDLDGGLGTTVNGNVQKAVNAFTANRLDYLAADGLQARLGSSEKGHGFMGAFDGQGYTISNLTTDVNGLFGVINGGVIKNVALVNCNDIANPTAPLAYGICGTSRIEDVFVSTPNRLITTPAYNGTPLITSWSSTTYNTKNLVVVDNFTYPDGTTYSWARNYGSLTADSKRDATNQATGFGPSSSYQPGMTNVIIVSDRALSIEVAANTTISEGVVKMDAEYIDGIKNENTYSIMAGSTATESAPIKGVRRYTSLEALRVDEYNISYETFNLDVWEIIDGVPTFKSTVVNTSGSQGLEYELNADGVSYSVIGIGTCTDTELVIPNAYNSLPVTAIASNTFECVGPEDAYWLKSVVVGNNVKTIGAYAFDRSSIQKVVLPEGLTTIEDGAFYEARELEEINIPNSVTYIADNAFNYCTSLKSITISDVTVDVGLYGLVYLNEEIPSNTYNVDTSFSCIIIGSEVKKILSNTFHECYATDTLIIAKGVETIESLAFNWMDISNVIFLGTVEEWNAIEKGANWMAPEGSTWTGHVQCTDGQV